MKVPSCLTSIHVSDAYITVGAMSKASYLDTDLGMVVDAQAYMVANTSCRWALVTTSWANVGFIYLLLV